MDNGTACTGLACGPATNNCGQTITCGSCTTPETCGGGGMAGVCGCTPESDAEACGGAPCGHVTNNCGQIVDCGGSCGSGGCFVAGTLIAMADGTSTPIERVAAGDSVLGRGGQATRVLGILRPVLGDRPLYALNGGPAFVTASHPFLTADGWKAVDPEAARAEVPELEIGRLTVGDVLVGASAGTVEQPVPLERLESHPADAATPLYNLDVDGANTYVVAGLVVHNKIGL